MPGDHHGAERKKEEDVDEPRTLSELEVHPIREWYDKKDSELVETRMAPSASADDMHSTQLPKSKGTKRKLVERYPALKLVIKRWFLCLEAAWAEDEMVTCSEANYTFDQILKRRKSEFEQAGVHNALPDKVSKWWFHKMKAEMGLKYTVVGRELCHGMLKE